MKPKKVFSTAQLLAILGGSFLILTIFDQRSITLGLFLYNTAIILMGLSLILIIYQKLKYKHLDVKALVILGSVSILYIIYLWLILFFGFLIIFNSK